MSRQLITFQLSDQVLGIDIMAIREIRAWSPATPLPNVPEYVRGVVNLRGVVLPVLDLRHRLNWGTTDTTARHVIIVVQIGEQRRQVGQPQGGDPPRRPTSGIIFQRRASGVIF